MKKILVVIDMQNDFIDGALGTAEAVGIVDKVGHIFIVRSAASWLSGVTPAQQAASTLIFVSGNLVFKSNAFVTTYTVA